MTMTAAESIAELNQLDLPGYGNAAGLQDVVPATGNVLTLLVASSSLSNRGLEFLTSVRKPDQMYPWAISLPTGRVAIQDMAQIIESRDLYERSREESVLIPKVAEGYEGELSRRRQIVRSYRPNAEIVSATPNSDESTLVRTTRDLLERKFDIPRGQNSLGAVSLHDITVGLVGGDDLGVVEYNTSALAVVTLDNRGLIPPVSSGYESNSWTSPEQFMEGYTSRDPELMHPGIDGVSLAFVCTNGQCLRGGEAAMNDLDELLSHTAFYERP